MARVRTECRKRLGRAAAEVRRAVVVNISKTNRGFRGDGRASGSRPGEYPTAGRGMLRKSIFSEVTSDTTAIVGVDKASPASKYARRLEEGGVITAHGKLMAVPISPQAKAHSFNGGPRTLGIHLVRIRRPGRVMLLVEIPGTEGGHKGFSIEGWNKNKRKAWIIHYALTSKVTIGARPYLSRTLMEKLPSIKAIFEEPMDL